jgi:hypothetical protein
MNAMKEIHLDEAFVEHVAATSLVTDACFLRDICLTTLQPQDLENVEAPFQLVWKADASLTCLVLWFDTFFTTDGQLAQRACLFERSPF